MANRDDDRNSNAAIKWFSKIDKGWLLRIARG